VPPLKNQQHHLFSETWQYLILIFDIVGEDSEQTRLSQIAIQSELPSSNNGTYRPPTLQETGVDILNFKPGKDNFGKFPFFFLVKRKVKADPYDP
jgi:hypothetical protein